MTIPFDAISLTDAAELIGVTTSRVRQMARNGEIRAEKLGPRSWVVSRVDAERLKNSPAKVGRPRSGMAV
jgi:excisionase family DNA binding protein